MCVMIMGALAIFQPWICVVMVIGNLLIDWGFKNIFDTKFTWSGSMLTSVCLSVSLHYSNGLNVVLDLKMHIEKLELNDTKVIFYRDCGLTDENICMMNKYSELYWVAERGLVCEAQQIVCQVCSLHNTLFSKILYTPSLLQIIHILISSNTWYPGLNIQYIADIRRNTISAHKLNSYNYPNKLPATTSITSLEQWLLLKV